MLANDIVYSPSFCPLSQFLRFLSTSANANVNSGIFSVTECAYFSFLFCNLSTIIQCSVFSRLAYTAAITEQDLKPYQGGFFQIFDYSKPSTFPEFFFYLLILFFLFFFICFKNKTFYCNMLHFCCDFLLCFVFCVIYAITKNVGTPLVLFQVV